VLAVAFNQPIVNALHATRPHPAHQQVLVLAGHSIDLAFPSDCAVIAGAVTAGLLLVSRRLGIAAAVAALMMGFARVYVAAQNPADVAAGLMIGATMGGTLCALMEDAATRTVTAVRRTRLRPLVAPPAAPTPKAAPTP
jgi:membrane-associated phospholipid phosphatase